MVVTILSTKPWSSLDSQKHPLFLSIHLEATKPDHSQNGGPHFLVHLTHQIKEMQRLRTVQKTDLTAVHAWSPYGTPFTKNRFCRVALLQYLTVTNRCRLCVLHLLAGLSQCSSQSWIQLPAARRLLEGDQLQQRVSGRLFGFNVFIPIWSIFGEANQSINTKKSACTDRTDCMEIPVC